MNIGTLTLARDGGWTGTIHTLSLNTKIRLVPNDDRTNENSPAFRVYIGSSCVGGAWDAHPIHAPAGAKPLTYYRLTLDDPCLPTPLNAVLFPSEDGKKGNLVWKRRREGGG